MKRDIIITALLTSCLTATIFMVATSQSAEYDPWIDINDDGKIDIFDVVGMTSRYAATGDPTKNVTIAAHASKLAYNITTSVAAGHQFIPPWISVDGYSKISICLYCVATDEAFSLTTRHSGYISEFYVDHQVNITGNFVKVYDVPNQEIRVIYDNNDPGARTLRARYIQCTRTCP